MESLGQGIGDFQRAPGEGAAPLDLPQNRPIGNKKRWQPEVAGKANLFCVFCSLGRMLVGTLLVFMKFRKTGGVTNARLHRLFPDLDVTSSALFAPQQKCSSVGPIVLENSHIEVTAISS
jgi:hypothetical protein